MTLEQIASIFLASAILMFTILFQVYMWQRKEYRWDRMRAYLFFPESKHDRDGVLAVFLGAAIIGLLAWFGGSNTAASLLGWLALLAAITKHVHRVTQHGFYRPTLTIKSGLTGVFPCCR